MPRKPYSLTQEQIRAELLSAHGEVRERFVEHFGVEIEQLAVRLYEALARLEEFSRSVKKDHRAAWAHTFLHSALNNALTAGQLLIVGLLQPAGNLMRAFGESVAMALLISLPQTGVLEKIEKDHAYPVQKAIDKVGKKRNLERLGIPPRAWDEFRRMSNWYSGYSHASLFAAATLSNFSKPGGLILGSEFDENKVDAYRKQLNICISAAKELVGIIAGTERAILEAQSEN